MASCLTCRFSQALPEPGPEPVPPPLDPPKGFWERVAGDYDSAGKRIHYYLDVLEWKRRSTRVSCCYNPKSLDVLKDHWCGKHER